VFAGADGWRIAWGDGAHCPCAARHAAKRLNDRIFARSARFQNFASTTNLETCEGVEGGTKQARTSTTTSPNMPFSLEQEFF
jgi:hypothetical protein